MRLVVFFVFMAMGSRFFVIALAARHAGGSVLLSQEEWAGRMMDAVSLPGIAPGVRSPQRERVGRFVSIETRVMRFVEYKQVGRDHRILGSKGIGVSAGQRPRSSSSRIPCDRAFGGGGVWQWRNFR